MAAVDDDEVQVNGQTWNKVHSAATKSGYRDGRAAGRNSNFQTSFDAGYQQGYTSGFALGVCKGSASSIDRNQVDSVLEKVSRGNCVLCKQKELENSTLAELATRQTADTQRVLAALHSKCASVQ